MTPMVDTPAADDTPPTLIEATLGHDRFTTALLFIVVPLLCWAWIVVMAHDMYGPMTGASAWMMTPHWDAPHLALLWAMWAVMMVGMMLPSASPTLLLFGMVVRRQQGRAAAGSVYAMAVGYLLVWALFSAGATALQRLLVSVAVVSPMMTTTTPVAAAALLLCAGLYQLTPLKQACLHTCQSPMGFITRRWSTGVGGAFRMGLEHGAYCLGCCWALMLLLFVGGVMNLAVIAGLTAFVAIEKITPFGTAGSRAGGVGLILLALWIVVRGYLP